MKHVRRREVPGGIDPARVHRLRVARGKTLADVSEALGLPVSAVTRIEGGHLLADEATLARLARCLECARATLERPATEPLVTKPWLRAYADAPKKTVDQYLADTILAVEAFERLRLRRMPDVLPIFGGDINDDSDIDEFAMGVREAAAVTSQTGIPNVTRAAERLGCLVLPMDHELGRHLGLSTRVDQTPVIRVSMARTSVPGDRQRFTVAHELGHLTLHSACPPPQSSEQAKTIEKQAHRFAGAFLMPGDAFLADLDDLGRGRVTLSTLAALKVRWGVSIKAMVVRLQHLNRITSDQSRSLYKQISARGWNTGEPVEVGNEYAVWLAKATTRNQTLAAAAQLAGLSETWFTRWTTWEPADETQASILEFADRHARRSTRNVVTKPTGEPEA